MSIAEILWKMVSILFIISALLVLFGVKAK